MIILLYLVKIATSEPLRMILQSSTGTSLGIWNEKNDLGSKDPVYSMSHTVHILYVYVYIYADLPASEIHTLTGHSGLFGA